ncbi:PiT family inorganic phosphate transporter [Halanaerobium saccharolyticum]|uniref:PiT family inorganic phosphate transporter n=1 Tax=Halanaerobium saccharolyticum TaxID=43595 RepID=A0A2T5REZ1_9FIRM|nr:inorganic phosphate transporter [Halanaerobium saccharolyticum]PTV92445.1 PiT family inorganic phosphate transporter [Halanaerobium saccharolyticum]
MFRLIAGIFLGWALGSNDAANIFGTAVATRMVKFWTAAILTSVFVILGAVLEGAGGMETLGSLSSQTVNSAFITSLAAALTVTLMTYFKLPVSTSQAIVGAIIGAGIVRQSIDFSPLGKIVLAWVLTPIGAMVVAFLLYIILGWGVERTIKDVVTLDKVLKMGLILAGIYGAYALGANNVANVTGVFVKSGMITVFQGALLGGLGIASGVLTYSKNVMMTVGKGITELLPFSALVAVLAEATTVYIYARIGIPVSTSQAIVGAVMGIGLIKGMNYLNKNTIKNILFGWLGTPTIAGIISLLLTLIF